MYKASKRN